MKQLSLFNKPWRAILGMLFALIASSPTWGDTINYKGLLIEQNPSNSTAVTYAVVGISGVKSDLNNQYSETLEIPDEYFDGRNVHDITAIDSNAFAGCTKVTDIVLSWNIQKIAGDAFKECTALKALFIGYGQQIPTFATDALPTGCAVYVSNPDAYSSDNYWSSYNLKLDFRSTDLYSTYASYLIFRAKNTKEAVVSGIQQNFIEKLSYDIPTDEIPLYDGNDNATQHNYTITGIADGAFSLSKTMRNITIPGNIKEMGTNLFPESLKYIYFDGGIPVVNGDIFVDTTQVLKAIVIDNLSEELTTLPYGFNASHLSANPTDFSIRIKGVSNETALVTAAGYNESQIGSENKASYDVYKGTWEKVGYQRNWVRYTSDGRTYAMFPEVSEATRIILTSDQSKQITDIDANFLQGCANIGSIYLNESIRTIGQNAFMTDGQVKIASMTFPASLEKIYAPIFNENMPDTILSELDSDVPPTIVPDDNNYKYLANSKDIMDTRHLLTLYYRRYAPFLNVDNESNYRWGGFRYGNIGNKVFTSGDYEFTYYHAPKNGFVMVSTTANMEKSYTIPEDVNGVTVVGIGENAFSHSDFQSLTIPATVTFIDQYALKVPSLTSVTVKSEQPCNWYFPTDTFLPAQAVLYVPTAAAIEAYRNAQWTLDEAKFVGWEGYKEGVGTILVEGDANASTNTNDIVLKNDDEMNIGNGTLTYKGNIIRGTKPTSIDILPEVTKLKLQDVSVKKNIIIENNFSKYYKTAGLRSLNKTEKGLDMSFSGSVEFDTFDNEGVTTIAIDEGSTYQGIIKNNGQLSNLDGKITKIDEGKTPMEIGKIAVSKHQMIVPVTASGGVLYFEWQKYNTTSGTYESITAKSYPLKSAALRAAKQIIDSIEVDDIGDYRCLISNIDDEETCMTTLTAYGTVSSDPVIGTVTFKAFSKGYYEGAEKGKDVTVSYTKDQALKFRLMDKTGTIIRTATVAAYYKGANRTDKLTPDATNEYYMVLNHVNDEITVTVDSCIVASDTATIGMITLKAFDKGYFEGGEQGKDQVVKFSKDQTYSFRLLDKQKKVIQIATVSAYYKNANKTVKLTPDEKNDYYMVLSSVNDDITITVDSCSPVANEIAFANDVKVWGSRGVLHISAPQAVKASIISLDGKQNIIRSEAGDQQFYLGQGVFIIRIGDKAWKIRL